MGTGNRELGAEGSRSPSSRLLIPGSPDVSVLVPAKDESGNLPEFMRQAAAAFASSDIAYEVIVVDDGSEDDTWDVLQTLATQYPFLSLIHI